LFVRFGRIGRGVLMDHATGVVIGETAVVGDNVSMLHRVTLGGSGTGRDKRHPTIGAGPCLCCYACACRIHTETCLRLPPGTSTIP